MVGGGGGIRTHGPLSRPLVFKTSAIDHSATPPWNVWNAWVNCSLAGRICFTLPSNAFSLQLQLTPFANEVTPDVPCAIVQQQDSNLRQGRWPMVLSAVRYHIFSQTRGCASVHTKTAFALPLLRHVFCRSTRIRTLTDGFGDHNATVIPYSCLYVSPHCQTTFGNLYSGGRFHHRVSLMVIYQTCQRTVVQRYKLFPYLQNFFHFFDKRRICGFSVLQKAYQTCYFIREKPNNRQLLGNFLIFRFQSDGLVWKNLQRVLGELLWRRGI